MDFLCSAHWSCLYGNEVINNLHFDLDTTGYFRLTVPALRKTTDFIDLSNGETTSPTGNLAMWWAPLCWSGWNVRGRKIQEDADAERWCREGGERQTAVKKK